MKIKEDKSIREKISRRSFLVLAGKSALATTVFAGLPRKILANVKDTEGKDDGKEVKKMARLVRHDRNRPYEIKEGSLPLWICACGLSKNKPYCDGSHKRCSDEHPNEWYVYDDKDRVKISAEY